MEREQHKADPDDFAEIWRSAELRRTEEIGGWLAQFLAKRRQQKAFDAANKYPPGKPALG